MKGAKLSIENSQKMSQQVFEKLDIIQESGKKDLDKIIYKLEAMLTKVNTNITKIKTNLNLNNTELEESFIELNSIVTRPDFIFLSKY